MKWWLSILFTLTFTACNHTSSPDRIIDKDSTAQVIDLSYSAEDTLEALELATWFAGELTPPPEVVDSILFTLNYLRFLYYDSTQLSPIMKNVLSQRFIAPWIVSEVGVKLDSLTADSVRRGEYTGWNLLPTELRPDTLPDSWNLMRVKLHGFYNAWRLSEIYSSLPGVLFAGPNFVMFIADRTYSIFPGIRNNEMVYIFATFPLGEYYCFYYENGKPILAGIYASTASKPAWIRAAIDSIVTWKQNI